MLAAAIVARLLRRPGAAAFLGCGCGSGPSARSLPAAVATCMIFGPIVAAARLSAAIVTARALRRRFHAACPHEPADLAGELAELLPAALAAGAAMQFGGALNPARLPPVLCMLAGGLLGFAAAPCALGAVAIAGALHARSPLAATAFLCVAGIVDLRALSSRRHVTPRRDALAYALLAVALCAVALRGGDALVHPALAPVLGFSAAIALAGAARHRREISPAQRAAPILMLAGLFTAAPPPPYYATETTLRDRNDAQRPLPGRALDVYRDAGAGRIAHRSRPLRDYLLPRRRLAGRRPPRSSAAVRSRHVASCRRPYRRRSPAQGRPDAANSASDRPVRLSLDGYAGRGVFLGSSSSTGIPLGSSMKAIARMPLGDL